MLFIAFIPKSVLKLTRLQFLLCNNYSVRFWDTPYYAQQQKNKQTGELSVKNNPISCARSEWRRS